MKAFSLLFLSLFLFSACEMDEASTETPEDRTEEVEEVEEAPEDEEDEYSYFEATLEDVSGGNATGTFTSSYLEGYGYTLEAGFNDLPTLEDGFFYEGWIVRPEPQSVISTGEAFEDGDVWINSWESEDDLTDHTKYVLTLEPDDGDPAPADHILDGTITPAE